MCGGSLKSCLPFALRSSADLPHVDRSDCLSDSKWNSRVAYPEDKDTKVRRLERTEHSSVRQRPYVSAA